MQKVLGHDVRVFGCTVDHRPQVEEGRRPNGTWRAPAGPALGVEGAMDAVIAQMQALPTVLAPITRIRKEELN